MCLLVTNGVVGGLREGEIGIHVCGVLSINRPVHICPLPVHFKIWQRFGILGGHSSRRASFNHINAFNIQVQAS